MRKQEPTEKILPRPGQGVFNEAKLELSYDYGSMGFRYTFDKLLEKVVTPWQTIRVLEHATLGRTVVLDEDIMSSEHDTAYDDGIMELVPKRKFGTVLILGGGDCSLAARMESIAERVIVTEIDPQIPLLFQKWYGDKACITDRTRVVIADAFEFIKGLDLKPDLVVDDMFTSPLGAASNYYHVIASRFSGVPIISQTDSRNGLAHERVLEQIRSFDPKAKTVEKFVPSYLEHWTFTRYSLKP